MLVKMPCANDGGMVGKITRKTATSSSPVSIPCNGKAEFGFAYGWSSNTLSVGTLENGVITWDKNVLNINGSGSGMTLTYENGMLTFTTDSWNIDCTIMTTVGTSGGGCASGTKQTTTASTEYTIPTGLSSISKFSMWATDEVSPNDLMSFCSWDSDSPNVYQSGAGAENNVGSAVRNLEIGTQSTVTTNKERLMIIMSVNGGTVTVKTPTVGVWANLNWTWVAMQ